MKTSSVTGWQLLRVVVGVLLILSLVGCTSSADREVAGQDSMGSTPSTTETPTPSTDPAPSGEPRTDPVALSDYFDRQYSGTELRLGAVRARTRTYTSYDVTYRSEGFTISGVINVPQGDGPFPAVVLAHGWIERDAYSRGQGMSRERDYLAERGFIAFHVDYRGHADSDEDPALVRNMYLGYAVDAINAVHALRGSDLAVDRDKIALMGRSMGGSVVLQALEIAPGLVQAGVVYSGQSSLEAENYQRWGNSTFDYAAEAVDRYGTPQQNPDFWSGISTRPHFDRISEPVLMIHGTEDEQCPAPWAAASFKALKAAGVDAQIEWYQGEHHAFGPRFIDSMNRTTRFLDAQLT